MKRITPLLLAVVLACAMTCPALAAEAPEGTAPVRPAALYPTEVVETETGSGRRLEKVYLLTAADNPANIPTADFEREGYRYTLLDVTRQDYTESETREHTETVTLDSGTKDMDKIMPQLAATREVTTEDGFTGILTLDIASITVEAAGYWQASGESIKTSVRVKTRISQLTEEGYYTGGIVPYGYRLENRGRTNKRNKEVCDLAIDPDEAEVVKVIFQKYVCEGYGSQRICRYLAEQGFRNRKGGNIPTTSINRIIKNPLYIGILCNGESRSEEILADLQIIDVDLFERAQSIIQSRSKPRTRREVPLNTKGQSLLVGNVYCGHCGRRLTLATSGRKYSKHDLWRELVGNGKLTAHLLEIDQTASEWMDRMLPQMMEAVGVTEELKAHDQMAWIGLVNNCKARVEEIISAELICT